MPLLINCLLALENSGFLLFVFLSFLPCLPYRCVAYTIHKVEVTATMTADNNITVPASVYAEAKAWIASQEAFEAEHKTPAPLTSAQRKALEALRLPIGDVNYVGMLIGTYFRS